jgi:uncharacterized lipoprotein YddW (UPF0748 family)
MNRKEFIQVAGRGTAALIFAPALSGCPSPSQVATGRRGVEFSHGTWIGGPEGEWSADAWGEKFAELKASGIDAVLLKLQPDELESLVPMAAGEGIEIHAWIIAMMQGGMEEEHHEWYVVNRKGESAADHPAYVDYYKFMCPSREPVVQHLIGQARRLTQIDGLASVHLDYIRYPDVILPIDLWEKYGIVQDKEYPEYDYCYCDVCRETFKARSGIDPMDLEDPSASDEWRQYRYDTITSVVNRIAAEVHRADMPLTAAVFPTPEIAKRLVRQDWVNWDMDALMPMMYHSFYQEPVEWIGQACREGVEALGGKFPIYAGVFVPALDPGQLAQTVELARANGAAGVVLFEGKMPTAEHWAAFSAAVSTS